VPTLYVLIAAKNLTVLIPIVSYEQCSDKLFHC